MHVGDAIRLSLETGIPGHQGVSRDDRLAEKAATTAGLFEFAACRRAPPAIRGKRKARRSVRDRLLFCSWRRTIAAYLSFYRRFVFTIVAQAR